MLHDVPLYPAGYTHVKETHTSIGNKINEK
jgi:hypothetical protein